MTTEELILGHFEKDLTPEQEQTLAGAISSSPEVRSRFEAHRALNAMMAADAAQLVPSRRLDRAVVAASIAAAPALIGGGAWLGGKAVAVISGLVAVGTALTIIFVGDIGNTTPPNLPKEIAPAVAPATITPQAGNTEVKEIPAQSSGVTEAPLPVTSLPVAPHNNAPRNAVQPAPSKDRPAQRAIANDSTKPAERNRIVIGTEKATTVEHDTRIQPDNR